MANVYPKTTKLEEWEGEYKAWRHAHLKPPAAPSVDLGDSLHAHAVIYDEKVVIKISDTRAGSSVVLVVQEARRLAEWIMEITS